MSGQITSGLQREGSFHLLNVLRRNHLWKILKAAGVPFNEATADHKKLCALVEGNSVLDGMVNFDYRSMLAKNKSSDFVLEQICQHVVERIVDKKRAEFVKSAQKEKAVKVAKKEAKDEVDLEPKKSAEPKKVEFPIEKFNNKRKEESAGVDVE